MKRREQILQHVKILIVALFCKLTRLRIISLCAIFKEICLIAFACCFLPPAIRAQEQTASNKAEQNLEAITEHNEDAETEDDSFLQSMKQFLKDPINLNTSDMATLKELMIFTPIQIQQILRYKALLGDFISIYELQAVPGLELTFIEKIRPYITVHTPQKLIFSARKRLIGGSSSFLTRISQVLEKQKGFNLNATAANNYYLGSRQKLMIRYQYQFKNLLQYGMVGEKDAGEQFLKGAQKKGFDFYSAHLFIRNIGVIQSLAIGDFTVNLGQGLTQWQSLAFKKSADIPNIKRQLAVLRPYHSSGEIYFNRGAGITLAKNNLAVTAFISFKKVDANFIADSLNRESYISSFQTTGMHRTTSEIADKGVQRQFTIGGNIAYQFRGFHLGLNGVRYQFKLPIKKAADAYNFYSIFGSSFGNYSTDYSYAYSNFHFFGEAAITSRFDKALINGLIISVDSKIDLSFLYRNISKKYQSLYTNAFTENNYPTNEKGLYAGVSMRPNSFWRIDAYADFYTFPWLKYLVNAPSQGRDYLVQANYRPKKQLEMYFRYRTETKSKNYNPNAWILSPVVPRPRQNIRTHFSYKLNNSLTFRNRVELVWFDKKGDASQNGFLSFVDLIFKPMLKRYSGSIRLQYFETEGYESRLYAYENDVLYSFSIPVFYDKGYRYYLNINCDVNKRLTVWLRIAQTVFKGKSVVGSGLDEIAGNKRTEFKIQGEYLF